MAKEHFAFLLPVFNDWSSFEVVLACIDKLAGDSDLCVSVVAVNDGSTSEMPERFGDGARYPNLESLEVMNLVCNMGHQRAIAIGLPEILGRAKYDAVIVMDADGEDDPNDLPTLIDAYRRNPAAIVLAQRMRRSEGILFRVCYWIYKQVFRALTGHNISFGNYCLLPVAAAKRLIYKPNLWNSLPATVLLSRVPYILTPTRRGKRIDGVSHMSLVSLILHGLHAVTVFSEAVVIRLSIFVAGTTLLGMAAVMLFRLSTDFFVRGQASSMIGILLVILLQVLFLVGSTSLLVLQNRSLKQMIPAVDYSVYIEDIVVLISGR